MPVHPVRETPSPVTMAELCAHLRLTSGDAEEMERAADALAAAVSEIDGSGLLGRAMVAAEYRHTGPRPAAGQDVRLLIGPALSLVSAEYVAASGEVRPLDLDGLTVFGDGEWSFIRARWPGDMASDRPDALRVVYRAGLAEDASGVPDALRRAVLLLAAHRFEVSEEVVIGAAPAQVPRGVDHLIALHRVRVFG